jgi:hypothetical protein
LDKIGQKWYNTNMKIEAGQINFQKFMELNSVTIKNSSVAELPKPKNRFGLARFAYPAAYLAFLALIAVAILLWIQPGGDGDTISSYLFPWKKGAELDSNHFYFKFSGSYKIEEAGSMKESADPYWWVSSGGYLKMSGGTGKTIWGKLGSSSGWQKLYKKTNSKDTDAGTHPQNIFRLVTRNQWQNFRQEFYFKIRKINLSGSDNRNESNGILLFNRYQDSDDLYYAGMRVDGTAVIKKKIGGDYFTLAQKKVFSGKKYSSSSNPNLLPMKSWLGIRSEVSNNPDGSVAIKLYFDSGKKGKWTLVAEATDREGENGDSVITDPGYGGIRTDFMDVEFDKYRMTEL